MKSGHLDFSNDCKFNFFLSRKKIICFFILHKMNMYYYHYYFFVNENFRNVQTIIFKHPWSREGNEFYRFIDRLI